MRAEVWSYGGGVQTAAIGVLVATGKLPKPAITVMADTGREDAATWAYLREVMAPYLAGAGVVVEVAPHSLATVDLYSKGAKLLIPAFTATGKLPTFCSVEWKQRVVSRFLRGKGYGPANPVRLWLGMSTDEASRAKDSPTEWASHHYPLLFDVPLSRTECVGLVRGAGLPDAPKSSCYMCPFRSDAQWRDLRDNRPLEWAKAVRIDREIREIDADTFLHHSGTPLESAVLSENTSQPDLFNSCDTGYCHA